MSFALQATASLRLPVPVSTHLSYPQTKSSSLPRHSALLHPAVGVKHRVLAHGLTRWQRIQKRYALNNNDVPAPLVQGWDNRVVGRYIPSALSRSGMPTPLLSKVPNRVISLQDAILLALRHNPSVLSAQMQRVFDKYNDQIMLDKLRYQWTGLTLSMNNTWQQGQSVTGGVSGFAPSVTLKNNLGTSLKLGYDLDQHNASVQLSQELLQGYGMHQYQYLTDMETIQSERWTYKDSLVGTVQDVISKYIALIQAKNQYQTNLNSYRNQQDVYKTTEIQYKIGIKSRYEFNQIQSQVASTQYSLETFKTDLRAAYVALANAIGLSPNVNVTIPNKLNLSRLPTTYPPIDKAIEQAFTHNTGYLRQVVALRQAQRTIIDKRDALKWTLTATYTHNQKVGGGVPVGDSAGLNLQIPLDTSDARQALVKARVDYEEAKVAFRDQKSTLVNTLITDYQAIDSDKVQLKSGKAALALAQVVMKGDSLKFKLGKITPTALQQNRQDYIRIQNDYFNAQSKYFTDIQKIHQDIGDDLATWRIKLRY